MVLSVWSAIRTEVGQSGSLTTAAQVALAWLQAQRPWIVSIPGTTKLAHLRENLMSSQVRFSPEELERFTRAASGIRIVGERYIGQAAQQVSK
jgi:aryl-alcohol dehydrogenase-like predicted oxidoreductase